MLHCDLRRARRERGVHEDPDWRQATRALELDQDVQQFLRATQRERRHHHVAAPVHQGLHHDLMELLDGAVECLVVPIAVGRLHQQHVRVVDRRRVAHDRSPRLA
jgi:hypothetical protein